MLRIYLRNGTKYVLSHKKVMIFFIIESQIWITLYGKWFSIQLDQLKLMLKLLNDQTVKKLNDKYWQSIRKECEGKKNFKIQ